MRTPTDSREDEAGNQIAAARKFVGPIPEGDHLTDEEIRHYLDGGEYDLVRFANLLNNCKYCRRIFRYIDTL